MSEPLTGWYWARWGRREEMAPVEFDHGRLAEAAAAILASDFAEIGPPIPSVEECRQIAAAKLPPRTDGWSADGRVRDPWHGVSSAERERRCEQVRREIAEVHRPKVGGWRFTTTSLGNGCFAFGPKGVAPAKRGIYYQPTKSLPPHVRHNPRLGNRSLPLLPASLASLAPHADARLPADVAILGWLERCRNSHGKTSTGIMIGSAGRSRSRREMPPFGSSL